MFYLGVPLLRTETIALLHIALCDKTFCLPISCYFDHNSVPSDAHRKTKELNGHCYNSWQQGTSKTLAESLLQRNLGKPQTELYTGTAPFRTSRVTEVNFQLIHGSKKNNSTKSWIGFPIARPQPFWDTFLVASLCRRVIMSIEPCCEWNAPHTMALWCVALWCVYYKFLISLSLSDV